MALRVTWVPSAVADLESIAEFIDRDSTFYAKAVVAKLMAAASSLGENPRIGRIVPEWQDTSIRERIVYSYRLIYRLEESQVLIVAVIHGKRLLSAAADRAAFWAALSKVPDVEPEPFDRL